MSRAEPPSQFLSDFPFATVEGNLFTPVCLRTHWDPTQMLKHIIPQQKVALPQDFRPWVKVCKNYVTSAPAIPAPMPPQDMVFPPGGDFYPPGRYSANIDNESMLKTLNQPLDKWCSTNKYIPSPTSNMYVPGSTVPSRQPNSNAFVDELAMPQALLRTSMHTCRTENDAKYFEKSPRLFNNPTKQDRYGSGTFYALKGGRKIGEPMPHGGVIDVPLSLNAIQSAYPIRQPGYNGNNTNSANAIQTSYPIKGYGSTSYPGSNVINTALPNVNDTSFVGVTTSGLAAPVW
jgi:hypothetical protein